MDNATILDLLNETFRLSLRMALPLLLISMIVGIIIAIFQAATQINEQTMTFVPKLLVLVIALVAVGGTMLRQLQDFFIKICGLIASGGRDSAEYSGFSVRNDSSPHDRSDRIPPGIRTRQHPGPC